MSPNPGLFDNRVVQVLRGGSIVLGDIHIHSIGDYIGKKSIVGTRNELRDKIEELKGLSYENRVDINQKQHSNLKEWKELDWEDILK